MKRLRKIEFFNIAVEYSICCINITPIQNAVYITIRDVSAITHEIWDLFSINYAIAFLQVQYADFSFLLKEISSRNNIIGLTRQAK